METQARKYYSNHRSSYRRKNEPEPKRDFREVLFMQCIISGMMLVVILFISVIHLPMTEDLKVSLKTALSHHAELDDILSASSEFDAVFVGMQNSVKTIFGETTRENEVAVSIPTVTAVPTQTPAVHEFRIDEDILQQINEREDFYGEAEKKQVVPTMPTAAPVEPAQ